MERYLNWDGMIRGKRRREFQRFLQHSNPRVRRYAVEIAEHDALQRREIICLATAIRLPATSHAWTDSVVGWGDRVTGSDNYGIVAIAAGGWHIVALRRMTLS